MDDKRFWAKVDKTGDCWIWTGAVKSSGYGKLLRSIDGKAYTFTAHRHAWKLTHGDIPPGMFIDHRCHNRRCVNPDHLRLVTPKQNCENVGVLRANNTSGWRGVSYCKRTNRWVAQVCSAGHRYWLGSFETPEKAAAVALAKRLELFTHNDADRAA